MDFQKLKNDKSLGLLAIQKEERKVEEEMKHKQIEFSDRIESCILRRNQLKKKKEKLEHHIESFRHILQDSEVRKFRATQKISSENREILQRAQEVDVLSRELNIAVARKCKVARRTTEYKAVESFLASVYDVAPQGYLDENLQPCEAVMSRYDTLDGAKQYISDKRNRTIHEMEVLQMLQCAQNTKHSNEVMMLTTQLANLKTKLEILTEKNLTTQEAVDKKMAIYQQKHQTLFMVLNAIDNISESCRKYTKKAHLGKYKSPVESKLKHVQEFCVHWGGVVGHILLQWNNRQVSATQRQTTIQ